MNLLFENLESLIDAPNGIEKTRELILQLAVQGKLVKQDPKDEPASELLKKIKKEKEKLIAEGKIKKQTELPPIKEDEKPFELPKGWEWVRLNEIFNFIDYRGKTPVKTENGVRLITAKNIRPGFINKNPEEFVTEETYKKWMTRGLPRNGDLLFTTEAPLGNVAPVNLKEKFALAQRVINLQPFMAFDTSFMLIALMSGTMQNQFWQKATGMTAKGIKAARLKLIPILYPPLSEQDRIVEKVNSLMALLDELEEKRERRNQKRIKLNNASLDKLFTSKDKKELKTYWKRIEENFSTLYSVSENVEKLKQAILQRVWIHMRWTP